MELMEKLSVRRDTAVSLGKKIEEMLDGAQRKAYEAGGAKRAMATHVKNLVGLVGVVDAEVEKSIPDLEQAKLVKTWLMRAVAATENHLGHLSNVEMQALGEVAGHTASRDYVFKIVKEIDEGAERLARSIETGTVVSDQNGDLQHTGEGPRPSGVRPAPSIAQQRRTEETAEVAPAAPEPVASPEPEEPPLKKRRKNR